MYGAQSRSSSGLKQLDHGVRSVIDNDPGVLRQPRDLQAPRDETVAGQSNPTVSH